MPRSWMILSRQLANVGSAVALSLWWVSAVAANDGGIAYGGSPRLLTGHPTISMRSEVVHITVGEKNVTVDCRFLFRNDGPACVVRMGFPDQGEGAEDPDEESGPNWKALPPRTTFTSFKSYVDGKPAACRLVRASEPGQFWHAKLVSFPAHGRRVVRDLYTLPVSAQITRFNSVARQASYILHTGSSWHGPIGRTEVKVTFNRRLMTSPLVLTRMASGNDDRVWKSDWSNQRGHVFYRGPGVPIASGKSLTFVRASWRPTSQDDLWLVFDNTKL